MARKDTLAGKIALVTGGASGIGAALAEELVGRGAEVVIADRQIELAREVAARLGRATAAALDVRDRAAFRTLVEDTATRAGRLDLLFNNAGIGVGGALATYAPEDYDDVFDVNLRGVAWGVHAAYEVMIRQGSGHIVNTASVAGLIPTPANGSYTTAKHGVVALSRALRMEGARHGVRVSVLCPGPVRTPILAGGRYGRIGIKGLSSDVAEQLWERSFPMAADAFARRAIDGVLANEAIIVLPAWWKALWYLERLSPTLSMAFWTRIDAQIRRDLAARGASPDERAPDPPATAL